MEQYIAENKIVLVTEVEGKTPAGQMMVQVEFENGTKEIMPKERLELICTEEISDATEVQNKIKARVGAMLFATLHEYGIKMGEINGVSDAMFDLANNGYTKARDIIFGVEHDLLPLNKINNILIENGKSTTEE